MMGDFDWKVHVARDPYFMQDAVKVYLRRWTGSEFELLRGDGTLVRVERGTILPDEAGLLIPIDAWEALVEHAAGESRAGAQLAVLREWLAAERQRVDDRLRGPR
jgi:hypothetical protein